MKTTKRVYVSLGGDTDDVITARKAKKCARWKRKNRVKQLKRSLTRYKDATNLPKYSHELRAYKLLQHLKKPGKKTTMFEWTSYIHRLQEITFQMEHALIAACISSGQHLERRKNRETLATHKIAKSGQQTDLPPAGGQQDRKGEA